jgi:hypothetical protein
MEFLQNNWFWIVLVMFFIWMTASGRGCCEVGKRDGGKGEESQGDQH